MSQALAWIDGHWGTPSTLSVPLSDRGLHLADGLFETVLILNGKAHLLPAHLQRWHQSAALLGMATPPDRAALNPLIDDGSSCSGRTKNATAKIIPPIKPPSSSLASSKNRLRGKNSRT